MPEVFPDVELERIDNLNFSDVFKPLDWSLEAEYAGLLERMQSILDEFDCEVILKDFAPKSLAGIYHLTTSQRQLQDLKRSKRFQKNEVWNDAIDLLIRAQNQTYKAQLYINVNNALIKKMAKNLEHPQFKPFVELIYINAILLGRFVPNEKERRLLNLNLIHLMNKTLD